MEGDTRRPQTRSVVAVTPRLAHLQRVGNLLPGVGEVKAFLSGVVQIPDVIRQCLCHAVNISLALRVVLVQHRLCRVAILQRHDGVVVAVPNHRQGLSAVILRQLFAVPQQGNGQFRGVVVGDILILFHPGLGTGNRHIRLGNGVGNLCCGVILRLLAGRVARRDRFLKAVLDFLAALVLRQTRQGSGPGIYAVISGKHQPGFRRHLGPAARFTHFLPEDEANVVGPQAAFVAAVHPGLGGRDGDGARLIGVGNGETYHLAGIRRVQRIVAADYRDIAGNGFLLHGIYHRSAVLMGSQSGKGSFPSTHSVQTYGKFRVARLHCRGRSVLPFIRIPNLLIQFHCHCRGALVVLVFVVIPDLVDLHLGGFRCPLIGYGDLLRISRRVSIQLDGLRDAVAGSVAGHGLFHHLVSDLRTILIHRQTRPGGSTCPRYLLGFHAGADILAVHHFVQVEGDTRRPQTGSVVIVRPPLLYTERVGDGLVLIYIHRHEVAHRPAIPAQGGVDLAVAVVGNGNGDFVGVRGIGHVGVAAGHFRNLVNKHALGNTVRRIHLQLRQTEADRRELRIVLVVAQGLGGAVRCGGVRGGHGNIRLSHSAAIAQLSADRFDLKCKAFLIPFFTLQLLHHKDLGASRNVFREVNHIQGIDLVFSFRLGGQRIRGVIRQSLAIHISRQAVAGIKIAGSGFHHPVDNPLIVQIPIVCIRGIGRQVLKDHAGAALGNGLSGDHMAQPVGAFRVLPGGAVHGPLQLHLHIIRSRICPVLHHRQIALQLVHKGNIAHGPGLGAVAVLKEFHLGIQGAVALVDNGDPGIFRVAVLFQIRGAHGHFLESIQELAVGHAFRYGAAISVCQLIHRRLPVQFGKGELNGREADGLNIPGNIRHFQPNHMGAFGVVDGQTIRQFAELRRIRILERCAGQRHHGEVKGFISHPAAAHHMLIQAQLHAGTCIVGVGKHRCKLGAGGDVALGGFIVGNLHRQLPGTVLPHLDVHRRLLDGVGDTVLGVGTITVIRCTHRHCFRQLVEEVALVMPVGGIKDQILHAEFDGAEAGQPFQIALRVYYCRAIGGMGGRRIVYRNGQTLGIVLRHRNICRLYNAVKLTTLIIFSFANRFKGEGEVISCHPLTAQQLLHRGNVGLIGGRHRIGHHQGAAGAVNVNLFSVAGRVSIGGIILCQLIYGPLGHAAFDDIHGQVFEGVADRIRRRKLAPQEGMHQTNRLPLGIGVHIILSQRAFLCQVEQSPLQADRYILYRRTVLPDLLHRHILFQNVGEVGHVDLFGICGAVCHQFAVGINAYLVARDLLGAGRVTEIPGLKGDGAVPVVDGVKLQVNGLAVVGQIGHSACILGNLVDEPALAVSERGAGVLAAPHAHGNQVIVNPEQVLRVRELHRPRVVRSRRTCFRIDARSAHAGDMEGKGVAVRPVTTVDILLDIDMSRAFGAVSVDIHRHCTGSSVAVPEKGCGNAATAIIHYQDLQRMLRRFKDIRVTLLNYLSGVVNTIQHAGMVRCCV